MVLLGKCQNLPTLFSTPSVCENKSFVIKARKFLASRSRIYADVTTDYRAVSQSQKADIPN